jgi:sterol desaturase/sphingolipid hydroxylase (fatty acid hydroxylase superfamily)
MNAREFLTSVTIIVAVMVLLTLVELAVPLFVRKPVQRRRAVVNLGMTALTLAFNGALTAAAAIVAVALSLEGSGLMAQLAIPITAQIVASIAVLDFFFGYLAHRAMHVSPALWRAHRVHHSDPFVDVTTTYRTHPLEVLWRFLFMIGPVRVLGIPAEAVIIYRLLSAINGVLEHANVRPSRFLDRVVSLIWVTPNMHKVHHSNESAETDSNYGNILSLYDRLLGTFTATERASSVVYGLNDTEALHAASLPRLLSMPFHVAELVACEPAGTAGSVVR